MLCQLHSLENAVLVICSLYWNYNSIINNHLDLNLVGAEIIIAEVGTSILAVSSELEEQNMSQASPKHSPSVP